MCRHPDNFYPIDHAGWLTDLLELVASIKRREKKVIVGYSSHQSLYLSLANCDAIASGTFLNLRSFGPERFITSRNSPKGKRAKWYYCPKSLSEYKIPLLDILYRKEKLNLLAPGPDLKNEFSDMLFSGAQPTSTAYGKRESFMHYLVTLNKQCQSSTKSNYGDTLQNQLSNLKGAQELLEELHGHEIRNQERDFYEAIEATRTAIQSFDGAYGDSYRLSWR